MLDTSMYHMLDFAVGCRHLLFCPGSIVLNLGDVGSDQLDISILRAGGRGVALLPQKLVLGTKAEVRSSAVDTTHSKAAIERFRSGRRVRARPGKSGVVEVETSGSHTTDTQGHNLVARRGIGLKGTHFGETEVVGEAGRSARQSNGLLQNRI
jgi:hypothetical protein